MDDISIRRCSRCGLPQSWEITRFDQTGLCNYCRFYDTVKDRLCDFNSWQQLFKDHLNTYCGRFEYDAVVGFSGGKDSTYIVYSLKENYGCKVLAVTVDFGFMPTETAKNNISRVIHNLGVDHLFFKIDEHEVKNAFANRAKKGGICNLCTMLCWAVPRKLANERHIPFYVMGSDRGQLLRSLSPETKPAAGTHFINHMLTPYSADKTALYENAKIAATIRKQLAAIGFSATFCDAIYPDPIHLPNTTAFPLELLYFLFHPYDETNMKQLIVEKTNWQRPAGDNLHSHHDCELHDAASYYFLQVTGNTMTTGEMSVDVREGTIHRDQAIQALAREKEHLLRMISPYEAFEKFFNVSHKYVEAAAKKVGRRLSTMIFLRKIQLLFHKPKVNLLDNINSKRTFTPSDTSIPSNSSSPGTR